MFQFLMEVKPKNWRSKALPNAEYNISKIPEQLSKMGNLLTKTIKQNLSGRILKPRSGRLRASWKFEVVADGKGWKLIPGSDVIYARIHEYGGWSGPNRKVRTPARHYVSDAISRKREAVRSMLRNYVARLTTR